MTRVTLGEFKMAARNRMLRRDAAGASRGFPTPFPMASRAVRCFHRRGAAEAIAELNGVIRRSGYWGPGGRPQARRWAETIIECFETYIGCASSDNRATLDMSISTDVEVGNNAIGVSLDVVLLDPHGYVGRYLLWDTPELTRDDAELLAALVVGALQKELGVDRVVGAEVWHLRTGSQMSIASATALARLDEIERIVNHYLS